MNIAANGVIYGPKIGKKKRWYPEHRRAAGIKRDARLLRKVKTKLFVRAKRLKYTRSGKSSTCLVRTANTKTHSIVYGQSKRPQALILSATLTYFCTIAASEFVA